MCRVQNEFDHAQNKTYFVWQEICMEINWCRNNGSHLPTSEPFDESQQLAQYVNINNAHLTIS